MYQATRRHTPVTTEVTSRTFGFHKRQMYNYQLQRHCCIQSVACPYDIRAVMSQCATSFSSGILSAAPVMTRPHNNARARYSLQVINTWCAQVILHSGGRSARCSGLHGVRTLYDHITYQSSTCRFNIYAS